MKTKQLKNLGIILLAMFFSISLFSQKVLHTENGQTINIKKYKPKVEKGFMYLAYKSIDNPKEWQKIHINQVYYVEHNNKKAIAYYMAKGYVIKNYRELSDIQLRARVDACKNLKFSGAVWGTFVPSFLFMPAGLITAIIVSSTSPKKLNMTNTDYTSNPEYIEAYKKQAKSNKSNSAWTGFVTGFSLAITLGVLIGTI